MNPNTVILTIVEAESGKICLEAETFWKNELEVEADSEAINFTRSRKRKTNIEKADANLEAWHFKRNWKRDTSRGIGRERIKKLTASTSL